VLAVAQHLRVATGGHPARPVALVERWVLRRQGVERVGRERAEALDAERLDPVRRERGLDLVAEPDVGARGGELPSERRVVEPELHR